MGDRVLFLVKDKHEVSPVIYGHWCGEYALSYVEQLRELMNGRDDMQYAAARLVGIIHSEVPNDNTGLGIWNTSPKLQKAVLEGDETVIGNASHGDAGVVIIDADDNYSCKFYGGYLAKARGQV